MSGVSNYVDSTFREHGVQLPLKILFFCDFWSFMMILGEHIFLKALQKTSRERSVRGVQSSTSFPGGNQVDGSPPASSFWSIFGHFCFSFSYDVQ